MRKWMAAALLLMLPSALWAQAVVLDGASYRTQLQGQAVIGIVRGDSTAKLLTTDASGNLQMIDADRDRDKIWFYSDAINNQFLVEDAQDSTAMLNTLGWEKMALWVRAVCTGAGTGGDCDSIRAAVFAVQVRGGPIATNDSIGAHPWVRWRDTGVTDTVGTFTGNFATLVTTVDPSTEFALTINVRPDENAPPYGVFIPLRDPTSGAWWSAPFTSVRFRFIESYDSALAAQGGGQPVKLRADLIGWR